MKANAFLFFLLGLIFSVHSQNKTKIYLFPGQGSDHRIFSKLEIDTSKFELFCIEYGVPSKGETMRSFALRQAEKIDTTSEFILLGVSMGGMMCVEIAHHLNPIKTIVISSAKTNHELPRKYTAQKKLGFYKWFPSRCIKKGALILQPLVEPDRRKEKKTFVSMLKMKPAIYFKRTVALIINWERQAIEVEINHIHGTEDGTIPIKNVCADYVLSHGSHMMTLTQAKEVSLMINTIIEN